jgi:hypothetical protein
MPFFAKNDILLNKNLDEERVDYRAVRPQKVVGGADQTGCWRREELLGKCKYGKEIDGD